MKNVLITGGCGFIGSNFVRHLFEHTEVDITVLDKMTYAAHRENLDGLWDSPRLRLVIGDVCNMELARCVASSSQIDTIVHFAAETHVDQSIRGPLIFTDTNLRGTHCLLEIAREGGIRFHHVGTDEVYGTVPPGERSVETDPVKPSSPYSASKAAADLMVQAYVTTFGIRATITRGANNVGPYQFVEKVVPLFATNALLDMPLPMYGDGKQRRDYTHVSDHCTAILKVLEHGIVGEIYNVGTGQDITNLEMASIVLDTLEKSQALVRHVQDRPGHDRRYCMNVDKLLALGWRPEMDPTRAVQAATRWYAENPEWWRPLREGQFRRYYDEQYGARMARVQQ